MSAETAQSKRIDRSQGDSTMMVLSQQIQDLIDNCLKFHAKFENQSVLFEPKVGDELILNGNIGIYAPSGRYQFNVKHIEVFGEGALLKAFEELKKKLETEGLFSEDIKKEIPAMPNSIAVITSETGAVLRDIITVLRRRSPSIKVTLVESQVQGKDAEKSIVEAIKVANDKGNFDLIILARGGGSIEDLWCFNMENVARAISHSKLPIISAIGHETDFTISDFIADLRAPTPSAAAEIISQGHSNLSDSIKRIEEDLVKSILNKINFLNDFLQSKFKLIRHPGDKLRETSQKIDNLEIRVRNSLNNRLLQQSRTVDQSISNLKALSPQIKIQAYQNKLDILFSDLVNLVKVDLEEKKKRYSIDISTLEAVSPLAVLARGYAIVSDEENKILRSSKELTVNQKIKARFKEGQVIAQVVEHVDET